MTDFKSSAETETAPLSSFAPRPRAVRIRPQAVQLSILTAIGIVAVSLIWAFVMEPRLKSQAREAERLAAEPVEVGPTRPSERVTSQPAAYDRLPPPRLPGQDRPEPPASSTGHASIRPMAAPARERAAPAPALAPPSRDTAIGSELLFPSVVREAPSGGVQGGGEHNRLSPVQAPSSTNLLQAGTLIPAVLLTGVDTARPGVAVALVSRPVYDSLSGRRLLVPQGSRLIGRQEGDSIHGESRVYLVWERLILPSGASLQLADQPTVDAQGAPGAPGRVDRRLRPMAAAALLAGAITTLGELARDGGDDGSLIGTAGDAAAIEASRIGSRLIDRELEVRTAVSVSPGEPVRVLLTRDLALEPWTP